MKVPKTFRLLGSTYTVHLVPADKWTEADAVGYILPQSFEVYIRAGDRQLEVATFFHELAHAIMHAMGKDKLYKDEAFIDLLGALFHQAISSAK